MSRLSSPIENIKSHYEVVVVGSGYGGGIAASRMARAKRSVCVLERGKEFQPGEYPDTEVEAVREWQADTPEGHIGSRLGLYDLRTNQDLNVFVGCGLGGTSLVNANVSLEADPRVFDDAHWPAELKNSAAGNVLSNGSYYQHVRDMLKPTPYPDGANGFPHLPKLEALKASAAAVNEPIYTPPINVHFGPAGPNHTGVHQEPCILCGDCCSGCNHHAKNTVIMNYLPDATNHGAEIFTTVSVRWIERSGSQWRVHYQILGTGREKFDAPTLFVTADIVILSAGTLGSTEILLRSRAKGLAVSDQLGHRLTGNGDVLAFGYNGEREIDGIGWGHRKAEDMKPVGPCITGVIDTRAKEQDFTEGMVIEEGSIPGAIAGFLPASFAAASAVGGKQEDPSLQSLIRERTRELESLVHGPYHGAIRNTQTYLVMTHDDGNGRMVLADDRLRVDWPSVGTQDIFEKANQILDRAGKPLGGSYVPNPIWTKLMQHRLITVHPLGGCCMAEDASQGVVNHKGQVFSGISGGGVYENLYVSDGAVVPRPLGMNPLLTISALAERCCALLAQDRNWTFNYDLPSVPRQEAAAVKAGVRFTETMKGYFSTAVKDEDGYQRGAEQGKKDSSPFQFTLTIGSGDLEAMLTDEAHESEIVGTAIAPALSAKPLTVTNGKFHLFVTDPARVETRLMKYRMKLVSEEGRTYFFYGYKVVHEEKFGLDIWPDTSTLYITIYDGEDETAPAIGKGILRIEPRDFAKQLTTMQVTNVANPAARMKYLMRFGGFFGGTLFQTYGGIFAKETVFNPDAPPRKKRPLRTDPPELHFFNALDGTPLKLTRYRGGAKGPVILSHGLGVSSLIFSLDTIETNLVEYLYAHEYDVWLVDYRASIDVPSSYQQSNADDVATKDYPAAVDKVREVTGADSVQMVVHCYGSTTFFMAMLAGLKGVHSAVCSQIATDIVAHPLTRFKTGLHVPSALKALGVKSMTAFSSTHANWLEKLFDGALKLYPLEHEEHCDSPVCHRITFLYSLLYEHAQLNEATHSTLHETFGIANISALEHLALLVRTKHLVDAKGAEVYIPHLERLAIPITFIHGAENQCFLPESTAITYEALRKKNGNDLYSRHVIPGYGHIDCIFGKNAVNDVYPFVLQHLEATLRKDKTLVAVR